MARKTTTKKGTLPKGTETEEWRIMSARVAWVFWSADWRSNFSTNPDALSAEWAEVSAEFRAYIRLTLRNLTREGIWLDNQRKRGGPTIDSDEWMEKSARFAWTLWLVDRRNTHPADTYTEQKLWHEMATEYRAAVRDVLREFDAESIRLRVA